MALGILLVFVPASMSGFHGHTRTTLLARKFCHTMNGTLFERKTRRIHTFATCAGLKSCFPMNITHALMIHGVDGSRDTGVTPKSDNTMNRTLLLGDNPLKPTFATRIAPKKSCAMNRTLFGTDNPVNTTLTARTTLKSGPPMNGTLFHSGGVFIPTLATLVSLKFRLSVGGARFRGDTFPVQTFETTMTPVLGPPVNRAIFVFRSCRDSRMTHPSRH